MPSIGEQGWGDLVNGNFSTIDTTMKGLDTRLTTCESTDVAYNTRLETLEAGEFERLSVGSVTISYSGYHTVVKSTRGTYSGENNQMFEHCILASPFRINGKVSVKTSSNGTLHIVSESGLTTHNLTTTQTEYTLTNVHNVFIKDVDSSGTSTTTFTIGNIIMV